MRHALCNKCQERPADSVTAGKPFTLILQAARTSGALRRAKQFNSSVRMTVLDGKRYRAKDQPPLQRACCVLIFAAFINGRRTLFRLVSAPDKAKGSVVHA